ncbi:MAG TPA: hypothetical protein VFU13_24090 [Steroidobacteraceae bacterium]|nr:hypothetical protein [Steroidobacteraceae bacterium]
MKLKKLALAAFAGLIAAPSLAADVMCSGTVTRIAYHANNSLMLQLSSMNVPVLFCSPEAEWVVAGTTYRTGPQTCKAFLAIFLSAKATGATLHNVYFDGAQVPATCDSWPNWASANIRYFDYY